MPTWDEILEESKKLNPGLLIENYISKLHELTDRNVFIYVSAFTLPKPPTPDLSIIDRDIQGFMTCAKGIDKDKGLDLIIHTPGGDYEATKRIISYLHELFSDIRVFVPHMAMSGGTLIACAANEIYMGPYSSLGPTDPQVFINGKYIPAGAIIEEFKRAFEEVKQDPMKAILWNERLKLIPPGTIVSLETMLENSHIYLKELLKERNCREKKEEEINKIVEFLLSHSAHSSHSRGISLKEAQQIGLNVKDLRQEKELEDAVLSIYHSCTITFQVSPAVKIIANHIGKKFVANAISSQV